MTQDLSEKGTFRGKVQTTFLMGKKGDLSDLVVGTRRAGLCFAETADLLSVVQAGGVVVDVSLASYTRH